MFGLYLYLIVASLLIYPHSTDQCHFGMNRSIMKEDLLKEKSIFGTNSNNVVCDNLYVQERKLLCDKAMIELVGHERYTDTKPGQLWNDDNRNIRVIEFVDRKSTLPVPQIAAHMGDSYACKRIPIEGINMEKRMYWCKPRVFTYWSVWRNYDTSSSESDSTSDSSSDSTSDSTSTSDEVDPKKNNPMKASSMQTNSTQTNSKKTNSDEKFAEAEGFFLTGSKETCTTAFIFKPSPTNDRKVIMFAKLLKVRMLLNAYGRCGYCR